MFALRFRDEASAFLRSAWDGKGFQVWQVLLRVRTTRHATHLLNEFCRTNIHVIRPKRLSDGIRGAVYISQIAMEIEDFWDVTEEFSHDDKGQAGFITILEGVVGRRAKETCERTRMSTRMVISGSLVDTVLGCSRYGHKCCFTQEYLKRKPPRDALQRGTREWTYTSEKGQGHTTCPHRTQITRTTVNLSLRLTVSNRLKEVEHSAGRITSSNPFHGLSSERQQTIRDARPSRGDDVQCYLLSVLHLVIPFLSSQFFSLRILCIHVPNGFSSLVNRVNKKVIVCAES